MVDHANDDIDVVTENTPLEYDIRQIQSPPSLMVEQTSPDFSTMQQKYEENLTLMQ